MSAQKFANDLANKTDALSKDNLALTPDLEQMVNDILKTASTATTAGELANLEGEQIQIKNNLKVLGSATLADTVIAGSLSVDGTMSLESDSINTLVEPLQLQSLGMAGIEMVGGKIVIDQVGNAVFNQNVTVKGSLFASLIKPVPQQDLTIDLENTSLGATASSFGNLLVKGVNQEVVASIDASGSATFKKIVIAGSGEPISQNLEGTVVATNSTAGEAALPAGETEIMIKTNTLSEKTLIYVTPTSETNNKVLFVKAKKAYNPNGLTDEEKEGWFKVGIDSAITSEIKFNWWIIN